MQFKKLSKAITWLETQTKFMKRSNLEIVTKAFLSMGLDLFSMIKIQVIGTNGKGSTANYIASILKHDNKVGLFVSPYLVKFNERISINGQMISDNDLLKYINFIFEFNQSAINNLNISYSFFELLTLLTLKYFNDKQCNCIIMEAGIGGVLDPTSILNYNVTVLTNIGFDHQKVLGYTKEEILHNKLGAVKEGGILITSEFDLKCNIVEDATLRNYTSSFIDQLCDVKSYFPLVIIYNSLLLESGLPGRYQIANMLLAINTVKYLFPNLCDSIITKGVKEAKNPGRLEFIEKNIIIDGAHNISGINALIDSIKDYKYDRILFLYSGLSDKDHESMIKELLKISDNVYLTSFPDARIYNPTNLVINFELPFFLNAHEAYYTLKDTLRNNDILVILGSIHFIGYIKSKVAKHPKRLVLKNKLLF